MNEKTQEVNRHSWRIGTSSDLGCRSVVECFLNMQDAQLDHQHPSLTKEKKNRNTNTIYIIYLYITYLYTINIYHIYIIYLYIIYIYIINIYIT